MKHGREYRSERVKGSRGLGGKRRASIVGSICFLEWRQAFLRRAAKKSTRASRFPYSLPPFFLYSIRSFRLISATDTWNSSAIRGHVLSVTHREKDIVKSRK